MNNRSARSSFSLILYTFLAVSTGAVSALWFGAFTPLLIVTPEGADSLREFAPIELKATETQDQQGTIQEWPQLFGPLSNSTQPDSVAQKISWADAQPEIAWRIEIGSGYSSPIIAGGLAIVLHRVDDEEIAAAYDLKTGNLNWEYRYPTQYICPNPPHSSGPYSTPLVDGNSVYIQSAEGVLRCLTLTGGELVWEKNYSEDYEVPENVFAVGHTPTLDGDRLILNIGGKPDAGVISIDKQNGDVLWTATDFGASYAKPVLATIHDKRFCFVLTAEEAVALNPENGEVYWNFPFKAIAEDFVNATTPVVFGDVVIFTSYQAGTIYLRIQPDGQNEELRRDKRTLVSQFNPLTCLDGKLYGWHFSDKSFRCVDLASGQLQWKWVSGLGRGTHLISGDSIFLIGESGKVAVVKRNPEELEILEVPTEPILKEPAFSAPAMSAGMILIRNEEELVCLKVVE